MGARTRWVIRHWSQAWKPPSGGGGGLSSWRGGSPARGSSVGSRTGLRAGSLPFSETPLRLVRLSMVPAQAQGPPTEYHVLLLEKARLADHFISIFERCDSSPSRSLAHLFPRH